MKAREKEPDSKPRVRLEGKKRENETHQNLGQGRLLLWGLKKEARIQVPKQKQANWPYGNEPTQIGGILMIWITIQNIRMEFMC